MSEFSHHFCRIGRLDIFHRLGLVLSLILTTLFLFSGCIERGRNSPMTENYTLEYPSPVFKNMQSLEQAIKVERFSVAKAYNTQSIVFRPDPYKLDVYSNHSWMVNPGYMISDYLVRDLRNSGLFMGIFSYRDYEEARFVLEGSLEEILETEQGNQHSAILSLSVALLDLSRPGMPNRLIYQKKYRSVEPIGTSTVEGLVKAVSAGMEKVSALIIKDAYDAVKSINPEVTTSGPTQNNSR